MLDRRKFLKSIGLGAASLNGLAMQSWLNQAQAAPTCGEWGDIVGNVGGWSCNSHEGFKILEIYLRFGASQWETFWLPGSASSPNYSDFDMGGPNTPPHRGGNAAFTPGTFSINDVNWNAGAAPCEAPFLPTAADNSARFANQTGGGNIHWGAGARPLFQRTHPSTDDIYERCHMVTQYHDLFPHEAAIPFALTGSTLGNPSLAGTGAAIQRRFQATNPDQILPISYVLHNNTNSLSPENYAASTGTHPGSSRPLVIRVSNSNSFFNNLARNGVTSESDDVLRALRHEYRDRMRFRGAGQPVRSAGFDGYWNAAELLQNAPTLQTLFEDELLVIDSSPAKCADVAGQNTSTVHGIKTQLQAAAELLTNGPARYVFTMDNGITGSYDTHSNVHFESVHSNMYNMMAQLASVIHHPVNNPSGLIDLDDTMIVINSEFGRTPWRAYDPCCNAGDVPSIARGRDHWPRGYTTLIIGGPVQGGASISGAIDSSTGYTENDHRYSPTDVRGAMLLAAGIDPFDDGNFNVAAFSDAIKSNPATGSEDEIRNRLRSRILGS